MFNLLRKYGALITLVLYLLPFGAKAWHDVHHSNDFHCQIRTQQHVHELEHRCGVCDISLPASDRPVTYHLIVAVAQVYFSYGFVAPAVYCSSLQQHPCLRGPPCIC